MPLPDFEIIKEMIQENALITLEQPYAQGKKRLYMPEPEAGYTLIIDGLPEDTIVIKADVFHAPEEFFNRDKGVCKRADLIIITRTNEDKKYIVFIEAKGGNPATGGDIIKQLQGAVCLLAYCREIGRIFWGKKNFLQENNYQYRFVSLKNINPSISKKPTRFTEGLHNSPEKCLKLGSKATYQFRELVHEII